MWSGMDSSVTIIPVPAADSFSLWVMVGVLAGMFLMVFVLKRVIERLLKAIDAYRVTKYLVRHRAPGTESEWTVTDKVRAYRQKGIPVPTKVLNEYRRTAGSTDDVFGDHPPQD
jgi:hypothetical protein